MAINTCIQRFLTEKVHQKARVLLNQTFQWLDEDGLEVKAHFFRNTKQCRQIVTAMQKVYCYVYGVKSSTHKENLERIRRVSSIARSSLVAIMHIKAPTGRSQTALKEHALLGQSLNFKTSKKRLGCHWEQKYKLIHLYFCSRWQPGWTIYCI